MTSSGTDLFDPYLKLMQMWMSAAAPQQLSQSILQGWSLITVNSQNSSAPDTEQAIVARASYGKQIGRLLDAVAALIDERPGSAPKVEAFTELKALTDEIDQTKLAIASARLDRVRSDLHLLREQEPEEFERQAALLRRVLA
jgi:hypothetical protein